MPQASIEIADGKGAEVLTSLNNAFLSLATLQSGSEEPASPQPFMLWADTTNQRLKIRHSNNSEWITLGQLDTPLLFQAERAVNARQAFLKRIANILPFNKKLPEDASNPEQKVA